MPTAAQIKAESYWQREQVPDALKDFGGRLRDHYDLPADAFGTVGNTAHLVGRHRSLEWNLKSRFATRRNYGTRDPRDTQGNHRYIRAFDLSLPRAVLFEVSRNVEAAVADGRAYMLAEWYGDLGDDNTVDGWFEGHDSTSDSSHKTHFHGGLWTIYADNEQALNDLFDIMTGADMDLDYTPRERPRAVGDRAAATLLADVWGQEQSGKSPVDSAPSFRTRQLTSIETKLDQLLAAPQQQPVVTDEQLERVMRKILGGVDGATPTEG